MNWTGYIRSDLKSRILSEGKGPCKLTLSSLSQYYEVSFTPVRRAVEQLIREGVLLKRGNGRLEIRSVQGKSARKTAKAKRPLDILDMATHDIVLKSLEGSEVYLREEAVAKEYGISRGKVQRIFHRLAGSGVIRHIPRKGWLLRPFCREDLKAFLDVREVLETKALELCRGRLEMERLEEMLKRNRIEEGKQMQIDNSLHSYILEKSANRYIQDFFDHYGRYYEILFLYEDMDPQSAQLAIRQHRQILEALIDDNWPMAQKALREHIQSNHSLLEERPGKILELARKNIN